MGTIMGADAAGFGRARDLVQWWKCFPVTACPKSHGRGTHLDCKERLRAVCLLSSMGSAGCKLSLLLPKRESHREPAEWWARLDARSGRYQGKKLPKSNRALWAALCAQQNTTTHPERWSCLGYWHINWCQMINWGRIRKIRQDGKCLHMASRKGSDRVKINSPGS